MKNLFKNPIVFIILALALIISALGVTPAFADDETPPPAATEEITAPATEEPTQPPVIATESPVVATLPPVIATESQTIATEPPVEETPAPEMPAEGAPTETVPPTEVFADAPENTDIVALDENNEALPLTSQEAAEVLQEADPKWCPEGELPNSPNCSINFPSIAALLSDMQANPGSYSQNGIIYFERAARTTFTTPFILDDSPASLGTSYGALSAFNITLTGGWDGGSSTWFPGRSLFDGPNAFVQVGTSANPWAGHVTINDIQVGSNTNGVTVNNSVTVYTLNGDIALHNVDVYQQAGNYYTALLQSNNGDITVGPSLNPVVANPNSLFDGNTTSPNQNQGLFASTATGAITISDTTFQHAIQPGPTAYSNGATLSAPVINLNNVTSKVNDGSGVYVNGTGSTTVNIFGGTYTSNKRYGVEATGSILNQLSAPTCSGNLLAPAGLPCFNVAPNTPPAITVNSVTVEADRLGGWILAFNAIGSASDAQDGTPSVSCTPASGALLSVGTTTAVSCTATDSNGLTATASGNVSVVDTTAPSFSLPSDITLEATGSTGAVATFTPSATDVVYGAVPVSCVPASGSTFPLGTTPVNCSPTDGSGNTATDSFSVIVVDTVGPSLSLPSDITLEATGPAGAVATFTPTATDVTSGAVPVTCTPASGSTFPLGTTTVNCSATDSAGNTDNGSFNVLVVDTTVPSFSLPSDITLEATGSTGAVATFTPSALDVVYGAVPVSCVPASGSTFPLGTTPVNCSATDGSGNTATDSFSVIVVDTVGPSLSLPSDITLEATGPAGAVTTFSPSATDFINGAIPVTCTPASGSTFPLGTTTVNCSATDSSGNTATDSFDVIVKDTGLPFLTLPADISIVIYEPSGIVVTYSTSAMDTIDGSVPVICVPASGSLFRVGNTRVTCSARDRAGNTNYGSFSVDVDLDETTESPLYHVIKQASTQLPAALGQGNSFVSALKLVFTDQAARMRNLAITLSFPIPNHMKDADLVVMFWDGSKWIEMPGGSMAGNYFVITVKRAGFYVLVSK